MNQWASTRAELEGQPKVVPNGPLHLVIDSTGLKLFGQGEGDEEKHGRTRRSWRKLHLAVDAGTGEIITCLLTDNAADDAGQLPALLEATGGEIASVTVVAVSPGAPLTEVLMISPHRVVRSEC